MLLPRVAALEECALGDIDVPQHEAKTPPLEHQSLPSTPYVEASRCGRPESQHHSVDVSSNSVRPGPSPTCGEVSLSDDATCSSDRDVRDVYLALGEAPGTDDEP